jgi:hypothetical protein
VISGCSQAGQSVFLLDNGVHSFTLARPCPDGLTSLQISNGLHVTSGGGHPVILAGRARQIAPRDNPVDRWMPLLGDPTEGLPVAPLGELAQQLRVERASSAGAVTGDVGISVSVAQGESSLSGAGRTDAVDDLTRGRGLDFPTDGCVLDVGAVNRQARSGILC